MGSLGSFRREYPRRIAASRGHWLGNAPAGLLPTMGVGPVVFQCKSLLFAWLLVRLCDHALCNSAAEWRNIVTTSCGADRRPDSLPPEDGAGDSVPGSAASLGYTPSPLGPGSIPSSVCPVSRLSSRALRARTLVFTFCLRRQPTAPRRWLAATGGGVESVHGQPYGEDP